MRAFAITLLMTLISIPSAFADDKPVLLIHGFLFTEDVNCNSYFGNQLTALDADRGAHNVRTIGWYHDDSSCRDYLPWSQRHDNTVNTPIIELAWELALHINETYTVKGQAVDIVAHSLGGLIVREMLSQFGQELLVEDVVTLGTPHNGVAFTWPAFAGCTLQIEQCLQAQAGSDFLRFLQHNPQSYIPTHWTIIGAKNDAVIGPDTSVLMNQNGSWKPTVSPYQYPYHFRDSTHCYGWAPIGHGDLIRDNPTGYCTYSRFGYGTMHFVRTPTDRVIDAIN